MGERGGFSLVELIVAITIFSIGVMALVALLGAGHRYKGRAQLDTQLTILAEAKLEYLRAVARTDHPDTLGLVPGGSLTDDQPDHHDRVELDGREFLRRWTVEFGPAAVRRITLRVSPAGAAHAGQMTLTTQVIHD